MHHSCRLYLLLCLLSALLAFLIGPSARAAGPLVTNTPAGTRSTTLPYAPSKNGLALVRVWIYPTGKKPIPATFLVDSGAGNSTVTDALVQNIGLTPRPAFGTNGARTLVFGKPMQAVTLPPILVGAFRLDNQSFVVISGKTISALVSQPVDGILGANMLTVYPALFDFEHHQITFFYPSPSPDDLRTFGMDGATVVSVEDRTGSGEFACRAKLVNGDLTAEETLIVDTGTDMTVIPGQVADRLRLRPGTGNYTISTILGTRSLSFAHVPSLSVGTAAVQDPIVVYTLNKPTDTDRSLLGLNFLSQFRVLLDYNQKKMYLKPLTAFAPLIQIKPPPLGEPAAPPPPPKRP